MRLSCDNGELRLDLSYNKRLLEYALIDSGVPEVSSTDQTCQIPIIYNHRLFEFALM